MWKTIMFYAMMIERTQGDVINMDGKRVCVLPLNDSNIEDYLDIYRKASAFSKIYSEKPDMWEDIRNDMRISLKEDSNVNHYLVVEMGTSIVLGYLNLTYNDKQKPEVDIAISGEYRRKGYGYEAAKTLIQYIFEMEDVQAVIWSAFPTNVASCRIAEKLGGVQIDKRDILKEAMEQAGFGSDLLKEREQIPLAISYEIRKKDWNPL